MSETSPRFATRLPRLLAWTVSGLPFEGGFGGLEGAFLRVSIGSSASSAKSSCAPPRRTSSDSSSDSSNDSGIVF